MQTVLDVLGMESVDPVMLPLSLLAVILLLFFAGIITVIVWPFHRGPRLSVDQHDVIRRYGSLR